jgi:hypothetical protein
MVTHDCPLGHAAALLPQRISHELNSGPLGPAMP